MKFVQIRWLYSGLPSGLQDNDNAQAEGQTAKDRAGVVTRMFVFVPHTHAGGGVACVSVFARFVGVVSSSASTIGFPPSYLTATTLQDLRLTEFRSSWKYQLAMYKLVCLKTKAAQLFKSRTLD